MEPKVTETWEWEKYAVLENGEVIQYYFDETDWEDEFGRYRDGQQWVHQNIEWKYHSKVVGHYVKCWVKRITICQYDDEMETWVQMIQKHSKRQYHYEGNRLMTDGDLKKMFKEIGIPEFSKKAA